MKNKIRWFFAKQLIRFKFIREVSVDAVELNEMIATQLPLAFDLNTAVGKGSFTVDSTSISIPLNADIINIECFCSFQVYSRETSIYRTHLHLFLSCKPNYSAEKKIIFPTGMEIVDIVLVDDEFSFMKDTRSLIGKFVPSPVKSLINTTFKTSIVMLNQTTKSDILTYLTLYLSGDSQLILDFHRQQIEAKILQFVNNEEFNYPLDVEVFDEKIFASFGKSIHIKKQRLYFIFNE